MLLVKPFVAEEFEQATSFFLDFFQKRKKGRVRVVEAPRLSSVIADTHAHLEMLHQPALNLARCAFWNVRFICSITDPVEDSKTTLTHLSRWQEQARSLLLNHGLEAYVCQVPHVRVAMGCHPHNAKDYTPTVEDELLAGAQESSRLRYWRSGTRLSLRFFTSPGSA